MLEGGVNLSVPGLGVNAAALACRREELTAFTKQKCVPICVTELNMSGSRPLTRLLLTAGGCQQQYLSGDTQKGEPGLSLAGRVHAKPTKNEHNAAKTKPGHQWRNAT